MSRRPPMVGWWRCCHCDNLTNPMLTVDSCLICSHARCSSCSDAGSGFRFTGAAFGFQMGSVGGTISGLSGSNYTTASESKGPAGSSSQQDPPQVGRAQSPRKQVVYDEMALLKVLLKDPIIVACLDESFRRDEAEGTMRFLAGSLNECKSQLCSSPNIGDDNKSIICSSFGDCEDVARLALKTFEDTRLPSEVHQTGSESDADRANEREDGEGSRDLPANHLGQILRSSRAYQTFRKALFEFIFPKLKARIQGWYIGQKMALTSRFGVSRCGWARIIHELRSIDGEEILFHCDEHNSLLSSCQEAVERWSDARWDWWPLKPYLPRETVISWLCPPCREEHCMAVPSEFAQDLKEVVQQHLETESRISSLRHTIASPQSPASSHNQQSGSIVRSTSRHSNVGSQSATTQPVTTATSPSTPRCGSPTAMTRSSASQAVMPGTRYVLLLVRRNSRYLLSQIDVHQYDDNTFFQALRSDYYRLRGRMRNWFSVWRYSHCDFYQFNKFDDAAYAPKTKDDYPQTRDEYDYSPDPMVIIPPITEHEFYCRFYSCFKSNGLSIHSLHSCRKASGNSCDALNLLPKKKVRLEEYGDKRQMFWGIYAQEIICFRWVVAYNILCLLPVIVFLFLWIFPLGYKGDLQNAAVPLTAMVGLLTLFWSFFIGNIKFGGSV
ncbi:hypothetical protein BDV19DRAFT_366128 [Aspergillus venezuelensis]